VRQRNPFARKIGRYAYSSVTGFAVAIVVTTPAC